MPDFGRNIQAARRHAGLTQQTLADMADINRRTLSFYENGHRYPTCRVLLRIAAACQVDIRDLFQETAVDDLEEAV